MPGTVLGTGSWPVPGVTTTGSGFDWNNLFQFGNRALDSFLGYTLQKNQQRPVTIQIPQTAIQPALATPPPGYQYNADGTLSAIGSSVGGLGASLGAFVQQNPLLVLGVVVGGLLLFSRPPRVSRNPLKLLPKTGYKNPVIWLKPNKRRKKRKRR
jgi:hypothetical protein